jgi:ABC-2 type transport system ATP-binding protein
MGELNMPLLSITQLSLRYENHVVLNQVNLELHNGEVVAVLGSNGAGKSSLLKCILGLADTSASIQGDVRIADNSIFHQPQLARAHLAYVPEQPAVYGHLSAIENIRYFLSLDNNPERAEISDCLSQAGLSERAWHDPCQTYSKGMKQKVMLALALAKQAKLLLLDEPNSGLDPQATEELNQLILQCKSSGMGVLVVTHDVLSAMAFSDRLTMLASGRLQPVSIAQSSLTLDNLKRLYQGQA